MFDNKTLAFVGSGQMAEAMIAGLVDRNTVKSEQIIAADLREERGRELTARYGVHATTDNVKAVRQANIVVLSVKPQVIDDVLPSGNTDIEACELVISIAAGVSLSTLVNRFGNSRVVRAMPNTPAKIGQGITVWMPTPAVSDEAQEQTRLILRAFGDEVQVEKEDYLNMATALSGTGPAYMFMFMEAMVDAGVHLGFSRRVARQLVVQTVLGSALYAMSTDEHLATLRNQVTSPGGTSAEALYYLEKGGLRTVLSRAIWAAYERSAALGGGKKVSQRFGSGDKSRSELDNGM